MGQRGAAREPVCGRIIGDKTQLHYLLYGRSGIQRRRFYNYLRLNAVRSGKWKLVPPRPAKPPGTGWSGRMIDAVEKVQLYDLEADIEERYDLAEQHPQIVARLTKLIDKARQDLGDHETVGSGARFFDGPRPTSRGQTD